MDKNEAHLEVLRDACPAPEQGSIYCFGPFTLVPHHRVLLSSNESVVIGGRALCLLIVLVTRAGEVLEKAELLALVWPRLVVEECNLRAQIKGLRRVLGGEQQLSYIRTIQGRGYRFVAPVVLKKHQRGAAFLQHAPPKTPQGGSDVIGRSASISVLSHQLLSQRFVTLTGPGGIGKTTVALAVAHKLATAFLQGVYFVDLAAVTSVNSIPVLLATALGVHCKGDDLMTGIVETLGGGKALLVLDTCEHALENITAVVERILHDVPEGYVLVTSREPLRAVGEFVHVLASLDAPHKQVRDLSACQALGFSAVKLFVERAVAYAPDFVFDDKDVDTVSAICRKLDNNPLAIELAAMRVRAFGIKALVDLLDGGFRLQMTGRRSSSARHQSLRATLDWSYSRLSVQEQILLRQLSVFSGSFTLEAAASMIESSSLGIGRLLSLLENLTDKSLIMAWGGATVQHYRLLETTQVYAREKLVQDG